MRPDKNLGDGTKCSPLFIFSGGHGGSTILPHINVTNEFPEYGTMEEGAKALEMSSEIHDEAVRCSPARLPSDQLLPRPLENGGPGEEEPSFLQELQTPPKKEEKSQLVGQLRGLTTESENGQDGENKVFGSETQMEKASSFGRADGEAAREKLLAGQDKPSEMPHPSEVAAERKLYWIAEEDSTVVLTVEIHPEISPAIDQFETEEGHKMCETCCHIPLVRPESKAECAVGGAWADFEREFSVYNPNKAERAPERRMSKETAVSKHVEFQGVEILWIQKAEEQKGLGRSEVEGIEKRIFSSLPNHRVTPTNSTEAAGLSESSWDNVRPSASLAEGGEDEVFADERKKNRAEEKITGLDKDR